MVRCSSTNAGVVRATKMMLFYTMKGNTGLEPECGPLCRKLPMWNVDIVIPLTSWGSEEEILFIRGSPALRKKTLLLTMNRLKERPCTREGCWTHPLKGCSSHVIYVSAFSLWNLKVKPATHAQQGPHRAEGSHFHLPVEGFKT